VIEIVDGFGPNKALGIKVKAASVAEPAVPISKWKLPPIKMLPGQ